MSDPHETCREPIDPSNDENPSNPVERLLAKIEEQAETAARRDMDLRNEIADLRRRVKEAEEASSLSGERARFGPFGIFHEDPQDGTYRLALPLLIAICGAIFGMLLTLV